MTGGGRDRLLRLFGTFVIVLNLSVAALSLSDLYLLASGAVKVHLPDEKDFTWRFDADTTSLVFIGNYTLLNRGFYDITEVDIRASVRTANGATLVDYRVEGMRVPAFGGGNYTIVTSMPVERLLALDFGSLLFGATHFYIDVEIEAAYILGMARFHSEETINYTWTPPLKEFARLLLDGNLTSRILAAWPLLKDLAGSVLPWVASAIMAGGREVTLHTGWLDVGFRYSGGELGVRLLLPGREPVEVFRIALKEPAGGEAHGGAAR